MKQKFNPTPLCCVNSVKYDIKKIEIPFCDFDLGFSFVCDSNHVYYCYVNILKMYFKTS
jgi:hypothetical protein